MGNSNQETVDFISRINGFGSLTRPQTNNLRGINVNLNGVPAPANQDSYGLTFFTRPDLNMTYDNISVDRMLLSLTQDDPTSMAMAIRCMLDSRITTGESSDRVVSDIFDDSQAFIPVLTNNLVSISGWPDIIADTYTSKEGVFKEAWSMVDGTTHIYNTYDLTANFRNIQGDPITLLMLAWVRYASLVYDGTLVPYASNVINNIIDYNTRIYRIVLNKENTYVQKIAACGAAFPSVVPIGASFNYSDDAVFNKDNDQISIRFNCIGANYMDPILIEEFNKTVGRANMVMSTEKNRGQYMVRLHPGSTYSASGEVPPNTKEKGELGDIGKLLINILTHKLYPRINPQTLAFEWWAYKDDYVKAIKDYTNNILKPEFNLVTKYARGS